MGCQHPHHAIKAQQHGSTGAVGGWARGAHQHHPPLGVPPFGNPLGGDGVVPGGPSCTQPAAGKGPWLLRGNPTGCSRGSMPGQPLGGTGYLTPSSSGALSPLAAPAAMPVSVEPPSPALTP